MLRFFWIATAMLCVGALPANARSAACVNYNDWKILDEARLVELGLSERVATFTKAITEAPKGVTVHLIIQVIPTDCPVYGFDIRAIRLPALQFNSGSGAVSKYGLYVAVDYLRNRDESDLVRIARQQVCVIRSGAADQAQREKDPDTADIKRCMIQSALLFGDTEYAKWLAKGLDILANQQEAPLTPRQQQIQRAIDDLKSRANPPQELLDALEKFKKNIQ